MNLPYGFIFENQSSAFLKLIAQPMFLVLMLGPESAAMGRRTAKNVGASPATLYLYVENVDKVIEKATKLGATGQGPVMDMFWGDRCGTIVDPDGYSWMIGTHKAEPTVKEMKKGMLEMMKQQPASAAAD
jgi:hypothetical protein